MAGLPKSTQARSTQARSTQVEIWFQDEARRGHRNGRTRIWAKKGTRPRLPADQRHDNACLFGAICPVEGKGAALMLPVANTRAMPMHRDEIGRHVAANAHGVVLMDRAGWHGTDKLEVPRLQVPRNITIILLPSRSPELNPGGEHLATSAGELAFEPRLRRP